MNSLRRFSSILSRSAAAHDDVQPKNSDPSASRPPPRHRPTGSFDHPLVHQQPHTAARALDQDGYGRGRVPEDCKFMQSVLLASLCARWRTHLPFPPPLHQLRQSPPVNRLPRCSLPVQELATNFPTPLSLLNQVRPLLAHVVALRTRHAPSPPIPLNPNDASPDPLHRTRKRQTQSSARQLFSYAFDETRWNWGRKTREEIEKWE